MVICFPSEGILFDGLRALFFAVRRGKIKATRRRWEFAVLLTLGLLDKAQAENRVVRLTLRGTEARSLDRRRAFRCGGRAAHTSAPIRRRAPDHEHPS